MRRALRCLGARFFVLFCTLKSSIRILRFWNFSHVFKQLFEGAHLCGLNFVLAVVKSFRELHQWF